METKVVMLGSGTPDPDPKRSGPCVAVVVGDNSYLVDVGSNVVRQANAAFKKGVKALAPRNLKHAFITHLHSDHTLGFPDLMMTPWIVGRNEALNVVGPKGTKKFVDYMQKAYEFDYDERINGIQKMDPAGGTVNVTEISEPGLCYEDELVKVYAILVSHIEDSFAFKFVTPDKTIVISGDKGPCNGLIELAKGADILVHEVYPTKNLASRPPVWQNYHGTIHTSSLDVGKAAAEADVKKVLLYHPVYLLGKDAHKNGNLEEIKSELEEYMVEEVKENFKGEVIFSNDLEIYE